MLIFFTGALCVPRPQGDGKNTLQKLDQLELGFNSKVMPVPGNSEECPYFLVSFLSLILQSSPGKTYKTPVNHVEITLAQH